MSNLLPQKTGIVIVSYNAAEAVRVTLASVRRAHNDAEYKLILVDNASEPHEREKIRTAMSKHIGDVGSSWRYIEQDKNLGFSGGNNIGTVEFLADEEISHICLLNSDVIVTDHWLDQLLASGSDIISAVTNKADGEQCVPVDYQAELSDCLDERTETIHDAVYQRISDFSERWHTAWRGNLVETDVTFFCVLLTKAACQEIGLLDDTFFPGGFEDDDYCLRARKLGYNIHLARDAFIHHWGSASFGQLQYEYFSGRAQRNKEFLEKKHGIIWQRRPEKPIVSFAMDVAFGLEQPGRTALQWPFIELYIANLTRQIRHFESEFLNLSHALTANPSAAPELLLRQIANAQTYGNLSASWDSVVDQVRAVFKPEAPDQAQSTQIGSELARIASGIHERVECNFAIHSHMMAQAKSAGVDAPDIPAPSTVLPVLASRPNTRLGKLFWAFKRGLAFIWQFDGIVFFGGYFYPERQSDGYFQRIQIVDRLFADRWRVYVESEELKGRNVWFDRPEPKVLVLRVTAGKKRKMLARVLALVAVLRSRKIYFHSVLRMYDNRFGKLMHLPFIRKALDIHGVVPEEFRMHNDFFSAMRFDKEEALGVKKAGMVIVVTDAMRQYLQQKFRDALRAKTVSFPMFPSFSPALATRPLIDGKPVVVYAGGLHKWQQVPKMIDAMVKTIERISHRFYCPDPEAMKNMLPADIRTRVIVEAKTHADLLTLYPECHYGFILREDIVVNRVACPTKLVEYLVMGIVPIVDCENIGDFKSLGMQFIQLNDFLAGKLPEEAERVEMAAANFSVYERLKVVRQTGADEIYSFFTPGQNKTSGSPSVKARIRQLLPPDTLAGRVARRVWRAVVPASSSASLVGVSAVSSSAPHFPEAEIFLPCDVLVQVDNFEAGGLENVVIDLNSTLAQAGYRVVLLVLGNQGAAVERARERGQTVIARPYTAESHASLLDQMQPKIVLAHYSFHGIPLCRERGISFVQIIHNVYMWFNQQQRREFAEASAITTALIAVSEYVQKYSIERLGMEAAKCQVIANGIDVTLFNELDARVARERLRAHHGIAEQDFVFLNVGAINHQKNHLGTIKAFEIAAKTCTGARLLILGPTYEASLHQEMLDYIEKSGLQGRVVYCGATPRAHEYLLMADAFLTGTFFEGASLTLLEALVANLPVVTPRVGSAPQFAGCPGIEVVEPVYDMATFDGAIWEMKSNSEFEQRLAEAIVRTWTHRVRPNFSKDQLAALDKERAYKSYLSFVEDIVNRPADLERKPSDLKVA